MKKPPMASPYREPTWPKVEESMIDVKKLAQENLDVVLANGFEPPTWENLPIKVMLVVTEVNEAISACKGLDGDPLEEELADIWIRVSGILAALWGESWNIRITKKVTTYRPIEVQLWPIVSYCCQAVEAWRHDNKTDVQISLELALAETQSLAEALGFGLIAEVAKKLEKNRGRERFHGKAKSNG